MISIKSKSDIEKMLEAGKIAAEALNTVEAKLKPGMTTKDIDKIVHQVIVSHGATPNFLGLYGFPASACVSVNEEVMHVHLNLNPGLLGEVFVCRFPETVKGYSNDNSLSGKQASPDWALPMTQESRSPT